VTQSRIAACLIVKNSAQTLAKCLASIRPHVDVVCIYDTGSTDDTIDLARRLNEDPASPNSAPIIVEQGEWHDDFSVARAASFVMAPEDCDWLLWLDDDDEIVGGELLRSAAANAPANVDGFTMLYEYAHDDAGNCVCQLWRERLVRRAAGYTWRDPIHEVYLPDRPPNLLAIPPDQIRYVHHRPEDRYPRSRNLDILVASAAAAEERDETPSPRIMAYIGTELMSHGEFGEAIGHLEAYLRHPEGTHGDERAQVYHKLATCLRTVGNPQAALEAEYRCLRERDDWAETAIGLMESYVILNEWLRVERWAKRALELGMPQSMLILNPLEFGLLPMLRLSEACMHTGRMPDALRWLEKAEASAPGNKLISERVPVLQNLAFRDEIVETTLKLRETLVRFDENAKALAVLDSVPYFVKDDPRIVRARFEQREMCAHLVRPAEYERWYRDEPKESTVPDEWVEQAGDHMPRARYYRDGLIEQQEALGRSVRAIDLGANDHWMGCYLWTQGLTCDGAELNRKAFEIGEERIARFGADVQFENVNLLDAPAIFGPQYDAVSLFEVIEHVRDVDEALDACEALLKPGGRVYISTPDGAFDRGNPASGWATVERKGHLRCLPAGDLSEIVMRRGVIKQMHVADGTGLVTLSYEPQKPVGRVAFYLGPCIEPFAVEDIKTRGLGGSETAAVFAAVKLAEAGYFVEVFADTTQPGVMPGPTLWRSHDAFDPGVERDAVIVSRIPQAFDAPINAPIRALWCHDHTYPGMTAERIDRMTHVLVLSEWQRDRFERLFPETTPKLTIMRNAILDSLLATEPPGFEEREARVVFSSSLDRGFDVLLHYWSQIRDRVPHAELHSYYGWDVFDRVAMRDPDRMAWKLRLLAKVDELGGEEGGVFMHGRVPQPELAQEMRRARVWAYPTYFMETSCISAMEARAAGLPIVTSALAGLVETAYGAGIVIRQGMEDEDAPNPLSDEYGERFVHHVATLLTNEHEWASWSQHARRGVAKETWSERAAEWADLVEPVAALAKAA
jgi:2-polyprenyl-3-methyl-5-hydroxy-6-metoxy-1,4-benzoquinol methylase/glycosyltransferase involved in cell wall biosynthesis